jgi:hypothetical protein
MLKKMLQSMLDMAASLPSGLSPELLMPREELCQKQCERLGSMVADQE